MIAEFISTGCIVAATILGWYFGYRMRKNPEPFEHSQTPIGKITEITDGLEGLEVAGEFYPHLLGRMTISKEDLFTDRPNMLNVIRDEMEKNYLESLKKRKEE